MSLLECHWFCAFSLFLSLFVSFFCFGLFSCGRAALKEALSIRRSVHWSVGPSVRPWTRVEKWSMIHDFFFFYRPLSLLSVWYPPSPFPSRPSSMFLLFSIPTTHLLFSFRWLVPINFHPNAINAMIIPTLLTFRSLQTSRRWELLSLPCNKESVGWCKINLHCGTERSATRYHRQRKLPSSSQWRKDRPSQWPIGGLY